MSSNELTIQKLFLMLDLNNKTPQQIKQSEALLPQFNILPNYGPLLLTIAINKEGTIPNNISHMASIQLKNYINSFWKYGNDEEMNKNLCFEGDKIIVISDKDKNFIRINILEAVRHVIEIEDVKIMKQLNQCVKKIIKLDFKSIWKNDFMQFVLNSINTENQKHIYAGIILFYQLSKLYEYEDDENKIIYSEAFEAVNDKFIYYLETCQNIKNNVEAMVLYKLFKMFLKNFQAGIPPCMYKKDIYKKWSYYIVETIKKPVGNDYIKDKKNIYWKLRNVCFQIITRVTQKYNKESDKDKDFNNFRQIYLNDILPKYYEVLTVIYTNVNNNNEYIDDYIKFCIYNFYYILLDNDNYKEKIIKLFCENELLLNEIINDCTLDKKILELWVESPKEYVGEKEEELNLFNTKKYRAMKIITYFMEFEESKSKKCILFDKIYNFLCNELLKDQQNLNNEDNNIKNNLMNNTTQELYISNPLNIPYNLRKESIIYLLKKNYDSIKKNADSDALINKFILPGLQSPCGLMREQCCHFISRFDIKNDELSKNIVKILCFLMENDINLQVRLYACLALGNSFEKEVIRNMLKGNINKILEISLKLMEETDVEQIMDNLQYIVKYFTEESQQYIVALSDYLVKYFNKVIEKENNMDEEFKYMDSFNIKSNIVSTFTSFIKYFINNENIYPKITNYIDTVIQYYLTKSDSPEEAMDILEEILRYSSTTTSSSQSPPHLHIYKFFVPLIQVATGTDEEILEFKKNHPNEIYYREGYESILDLTKLVCTYIIKDPKYFLTLKDQKGIDFLVYTSRFIENIIQVSESRGDYSEAKYCLSIIMVLFECYPDKVDKLMQDLIKYAIQKIKSGNIGKILKFFLLNLISTCFIYNSAKSINVLKQENYMKELFIFWFGNLNNIELKQNLKYNLFALCSIIKIDINNQDPLILSNMKQLIESIFKLTKKLEIKIEKEEEEDEYEDYEDNEDDIGGKNENKMKEIVNNIITGEPVDNNDNDEDIDDEELDEGDIGLTKFEKNSAIIFVKETLNEVAKNIEMNRIIVEALGDKFNELNDIFNKEEERRKNNK